MAWAVWWMVFAGVWVWAGPVMVGLYLVVSGAIGAAFARR